MQVRQLLGVPLFCLPLRTHCTACQNISLMLTTHGNQLQKYYFMPLKLLPHVLFADSTKKYRANYVLLCYVCLKKKKKSTNRSLRSCLIHPLRIYAFF